MHPDPSHELLEGIHELLEKLHSPKGKWMFFVVFIMVSSFTALVQINDHTTNEERSALSYKSKKLQQNIDEKKIQQKNINSAIKRVREAFDIAEDSCKKGVFLGNLKQFKATRRETIYDLIDADYYTKRIFGEDVNKKTTKFISSAENWKLCSGEESLYQLRLQQRAITQEMESILLQLQKELEEVDKKLEEYL